MKYLPSFVFLLVIFVCGALVFAATEPREYATSVAEIEAMQSLQHQMEEISRKATAITEEAKARLRREGVAISDTDRLGLNPTNLKWRVIPAEISPVTSPAGTK